MSTSKRILYSYVVVAAFLWIIFGIQIATAKSASNFKLSTFVTLPPVERSNYANVIIKTRGGSEKDDDEEEEEEDGDENYDDSESEAKEVGENDKCVSTSEDSTAVLVERFLEIIKKSAALLVKFIIMVAKALLELIKSVVSQFVNSDSGSEEEADMVDDILDMDIGSIPDFGTYLSRLFGVKDERQELYDKDSGSKDDNNPFMGGKLNDALDEAASKARLLVVFITSGNKKDSTADKQAITTLLSSNIAQLANKKSSKKAETGSFAFWGAKANSPEATAALKRLKVTPLGSSGSKRPTLLVAYPKQVRDPKGKFKIVPSVLAQHHCNPPPSIESMSSWLTALRKRHSKQYSKMQKSLKEVKYLKERKEGYSESIQADNERKEREQKELQEKLQKEKEEAERQETILKRRAELKESLPKEPSSSVKDAKVIALRFTDGSKDQRRFTPDTEMTVIFNWVDAMYELERETLILTTLNGQKSFTWDDVGETTLEDAGLGRMTALRVMQKKETSNISNDETAEKGSSKKQETTKNSTDGGIKK